MISLKKILFINGGSSAVTAVALIAFPSMIADLFEISNAAVFTGVGVFLLAFAGVVLWEASSSNTKPKRVQFIILMDSLWVAASLIVVVMMANTISFVGNSLILAVALWVGAMAYLQARGLRGIDSRI